MTRRAPRLDWIPQHFGWYRLTEVRSLPPSSCRFLGRAPEVLGKRFRDDASETHALVQRLDAYGRDQILGDGDGEFVSCLRLLPFFHQPIVRRQGLLRKRVGCRVLAHPLLLAFSNCTGSKTNKGG
jgi:hypothetical protein